MCRKPNTFYCVVTYLHGPLFGEGARARAGPKAWYRPRGLVQQCCRTGRGDGPIFSRRLQVGGPSGTYLQ